jgi:8-amino-7-oxononanoate synthase
LAKAFGVPIAVLSGSAAIVRGFEERSETRVHASPPSVAHLHAAAHALRVNAAQGDALRDRLARRVAHFRRRLRGLGLRGPRSLFPVQAFDLGEDPARVHRALHDRGVATAMVQACDERAGRLVFVVTASHSAADLDRAAAALAAALG